MPKSDTWPGDVAVRSISSMESADSCDSVVSVNSVFSNDSLGHLTAEEQACLSFLEKTIDSLEVEEEDSGLSNVEADIPQPLALLSLPSVQGGSLDDVSKYPSTDPNRDGSKDHKNSLSYSQLTPLVLAKSLQPKSAAKHSPANSIRLTDLLPDKVDLGQQALRTPGGVVGPDLMLIPPPSDFMDRPKEQKAQQPIGSNLSPEDLENLRKRASLKKAPQIAPETKVQPPSSDQAHDQSVLPCTPGSTPGLPHKTNRPSVAPKPKRLPSNIILKTHKVPPPGPDSSGSCQSTLPSERTVMDPQKVRMEALRKLGLLKDDESNLGLALSPLHSPKFFGSTPPLSPASADLPHPLTPPPQFIPSPLLATGGRREPETQLRSGIPTVNINPPRRPDKIESAHVERSASSYNSGRSSSDFSQDGSLSVTGVAPVSSVLMRNNRPRPSSLGNHRDFTAVQGVPPRSSFPALAPSEALRKDEVRRSLPSPAQLTRGPSTLPRSQGITVLITPRSKTGEDHREALKKLGLLKD